MWLHQPKGQLRRAWTDCAAGMHFRCLDWCAVDPHKFGAHLYTHFVLSSVLHYLPGTQLHRRVMQLI